MRIIDWSSDVCSSDLHAAWVGGKLALHGIEFRKLDAALPAAKVEAFRADETAFDAKSVEGHQRLSLEGGWKPETRDVAAGALFVPIAQAKARLVMAIVEPQAPHAIAAWGEINNAFERKEYMEPYVAVEVARVMLAKDGATKERVEGEMRE